MQTSAAGRNRWCRLFSLNGVGRLEFTVTHTDYTVDARPIVPDGSRAGSSDAVVLTFVVIAAPLVRYLFRCGVKEPITPSGFVVLLVTILQVETAVYSLRPALALEILVTVK